MENNHPASVKSSSAIPIPPIEMAQKKAEIKAEMPSLSKIKIAFMFHFLFLAKE